MCELEWDLAASREEEEYAARDFRNNLAHNEWYKMGDIDSAYNDTDDAYSLSLDMNDSMPDREEFYDEEEDENLVEMLDIEMRLRVPLDTPRDRHALMPRLPFPDEVLWV